jgi:hypothetical protein
VWGGILDFLPYGEVRSALVVGKHIAVEAVKYVETISVLKPQEMNVPATQRFPNIEEVRILCLLHGTGEFDDDNEIYTLSLETTYSTAPFLAAFPKLKRAVLGGLLKYRDGDEDGQIITDVAQYDEECSGPTDHEEMFRGLVVSLGSAFRMGLLSRDVTIEGVSHYSWSLVRPCNQSRERTETDSCSWCRNICKNFPLPYFLRQGPVPRDYCLKTMEFWTIIARRPGGKQAIEKANGLLCRMICSCLSDCSATVENIPSDVGQRMKNDNLRMLRVWRLSETSLSEIDEMIAVGFDPTQIREDYFVKELIVYLRRGGRQQVYSAWTKSTVAELSSRGFPVDSITTFDDMHLM